MHKILLCGLSRFQISEFLKRTSNSDISTINVDIRLCLQLRHSCQASTTTNMCMEFEFSMKDNTKMDISGA